MLNHEFDRQNGILYLTPSGRLEKNDFVELGAQIDPYIKDNGKIEGIVITANNFPYWRDFEAMMAHFKFVKDHHKNVKKIALVSDDKVASIFPALIRNFVSAQVRHFQNQDRQAAEAWVREGHEVHTAQMGA